MSLLKNIKYLLYKYDNLFFYLAIFFYICVTICGLVYHEVWLDEAQAWLISQDLNFFQILKQMHHEGHLFLWYVILMPFTKFNIPYPLPMLIVNLLFVWFSIFILWKKAPINPLIKLLITFSAPICFAFPIVARCYGIGIFLLFLLIALYKEKFNRPYLYALLIVLCANTSLMCLISASVFGILFIVEYISSKKYFYRNREFYILLFIGLIGVTLILYQIIGALGVQDTFDANLGRQVSPYLVINRIAFALFGIDSYYFDDKDHISILNILACLIYFVVSLLLFIRQKQAFFYYLFTNSCLIYVMLFIYNGYYIHSYFYFINLIISFWLYKLEYNSEKETNVVYYIFNVVFFIILISLFIFNCKFYYFEITEKCSNAKILAETLYPYKNENILVCDLWGYSLIPYLRNKNISSDSFYTGKTASFFDYTFEKPFNTSQIEDIVSYVRQSYTSEKVYLITMISAEKWDNYNSELYMPRVLKCESGGFFRYPDLCIVELSKKK